MSSGARESEPPLAEKNGPSARLTAALIFSATLALGMATRSWWDPPPPPVVAAPPAAPPAPARRPPSPETFEALYRWRESHFISEKLTAQLDEVKAFFLENPIESFIDLDPWTLPIDQVMYLHYFCDQGYFTVELEIRLYELKSQAAAAKNVPATSSRIAQRLHAATADQSATIESLQEAIKLYSRGREGQITVPTDVSEETAQQKRAELIDKLAHQRQRRAQLQQRIREEEAFGAN
jgi:hypothetical protein